MLHNEPDFQKALMQQQAAKPASFNRRHTSSSRQQKQKHATDGSVPKVWSTTIGNSADSGIPSNEDESTNSSEINWTD